MTQSSILRHYCPFLYTKTRLETCNETLGFIELTENVVRHLIVDHFKRDLHASVEYPFSKSESQREQARQIVRNGGKKKRNVSVARVDFFFSFRAAKANVFNRDYRDYEASFEFHFETIGTIQRTNVLLESSVKSRSSSTLLVIHCVNVRRQP